MLVMVLDATCLDCYVDPQGEKTFGRGDEKKEKKTFLTTAMNQQEKGGTDDKGGRRDLP